MNLLKQTALRAFVFLIITSIAQIASAQQWKSTGGPYGGQIRCMATAGSTLYAGTYGHGVFWSKDNGATWAPIKVNSTTMDTTVFSIAASGNMVIAGTRGGLAIVSTDAGASWAAYQATQQQEDVSSVAIRGTTLFVSSVFEGVLVSTDNGQTWTVRNSGLRSNSISAMASSGNTVYAALANPSPGYSNLRKTTNDGVKWDSIDYVQMNPNVHVIGAMNNVLVVGTDGGVYFSIDGGGHWVQNNTNLADTTVYSFTATQTTAFVGTVDYTSNSGGVYTYDLSKQLAGAWTKATSGMSGFGSDKVYAMACIGSNVVAGTDNGIYATANNGTSWAASNTGLSAMLITTLKASGNTLVAGTDVFDVHISTDAGAHWTHTSDGMIDLVAGTRPAVYDVAIAGSTIFAGTDSGVYSTSDNGGHWTLSTSPLLRDTAVYALYTNGTILLAGSYSGIFASTNSGKTFVNAGTGLTAHGVTSITANGTGTKVYTGSNEGGVFSAVVGASPAWIAVKSGMESAATTPVASLTSNTSNVFAGTLGSGVFAGNGISWTQIAGNLPTSTRAVGMATNSDTLFVASQNQGIYRTHPGATGWHTDAFGLSDTMLRSIAVSNNTVFAGTADYGVVSSPAEMVPVPPDLGVTDAGLPTFAISSVAPNPTNAATSISFSLAQQGAVSLSIFDATGHEISLVKEMLSEGMHSYTLDVSHIVAGVYLCRLTANGKSITRNLVVAH